MGEGTVLLRRRALGDVLLLGAIASQVEPPVTVITEERYHEVVRRLRGVDAVLPWGAEPPPGRVVDLHTNKRSVQRRVRAFLGVGPKRPLVALLYAETAGTRTAHLPWIELPPAPRQDVLAVFPGAASPLKQWGGFGVVARRWEGPVVVLGGPDDEEACQLVAREVPGAEVVVERGFERTLLVLARTSVALTNDSGPMHLAGACGVHVIAVFGPTHPHDGFFSYLGAFVHRPELTCRPCTLHRRRRCPLGDRRCLDIAPEAVWEKVRICAG